VDTLGARLVADCRPFILQYAIRCRPEPYEHRSSLSDPSRGCKEVVIEHNPRLGT
jgi:hypothetical protein